MWHEYGVDLMISGHVHTYERLGSIYQNESSIKQESQPVFSFTNAPSTIYIVNGDAGNAYFMDPAFSPLPYSEFVDSGVTFGVLTIYNESTLYYQQIQSNSSAVIDYVWVLKTNQNDDSGNMPFYYVVLIIMGVMIIFIGLITYQCYKRRKQTDQTDESEAVLSSIPQSHVSSSV